VLALRLGRTTDCTAAVRRAPHSFNFTPPRARALARFLPPHPQFLIHDPPSPACSVLSLSLSLSLRRLGVGYRRRPTPGAEAFVGLFSGDEHPSGIPTPSLPFLPCDCAKPSTQTLSYLAI
jgi:hypothetical protein